MASIALNSPKIQALGDVAFYREPWGLGWLIPVARAGSKFAEKRELARLRSDPLARRVNEVARRSEHAATDRILAALDAEAPQPLAEASTPEAAPSTPEPAPSPLLPADAEPDPLQTAREENARRRADITAWHNIKRQAEDELLAEGVLTVFDLRTRDVLFDKAVDLVLAAADALRAQGRPAEWQGVYDTEGNALPLTEENVRALLESDARIDEGEGAGDEVGSHLVGAILAHATRIDLYRLRSLEALEKNSERHGGGTSAVPTSELVEN